MRRTQLEAAQEAARAWAKELQAQHADAERLGEREAQLEAFAAAVREGLDALGFEGAGTSLFLRSMGTSSLGFDSAGVSTESGQAQAPLAGNGGVFL